MNSKAPEVVLAAIVLLLTSALATGYVNLPYAPLSSPWAVVALVVASLGAFVVSPAVGLSLFVLTAVLFFKRNVDKTVSYTSTYGETSIMTQGADISNPYNETATTARNYDEFQETNPSNPLLGPKVENFEPAPFGDEDGGPVDGQFPKEGAQVNSQGVPVDYTYRPEPDTGDNAFARFGPDLDEKKMSFTY